MFLFSATHFWDEFALIVVLGKTGWESCGKTVSNHLRRFHQFEE